MAWVPAPSPPVPWAPFVLVQLSCGRGCSSRNVHRTPGGLADTRVRPNRSVARTRTCIPHTLLGDFTVVDQALSSKVPAHGPPLNVPGSRPRCDLGRASSFTCSAGPLTFARLASVPLSHVPAQRSPVPRRRRRATPWLLRVALAGIRWLLLVVPSPTVSSLGTSPAHPGDFITVGLMVVER